MNENKSAYTFITYTIKHPARQSKSLAVQCAIGAQPLLFFFYLLTFAFIFLHFRFLLSFFISKHIYGNGLNSLPIMPPLITG